MWSFEWEGEIVVIPAWPLLHPRGPCLVLSGLFDGAGCRLNGSFLSASRLGCGGSSTITYITIRTHHTSFLRLISTVRIVHSLIPVRHQVLDIYGSHLRLPICVLRRALPSSPSQLSPILRSTLETPRGQLTTLCDSINTHAPARILSNALVCSCLARLTKVDISSCPSCVLVFLSGH